MLYHYASIETDKHAHPHIYALSLRYSAIILEYLFNCLTIHIINMY